MSSILKEIERLKKKENTKKVNVKDNTFFSLMFKDVKPLGNDNRV